MSLEETSSSEASSRQMMPLFPPCLEAPRLVESNPVNLAPNAHGIGLLGLKSEERDHVLL